MSKSTSKFQRAIALKAAKHLWDRMRTVCLPERFIVAGSLRRMKAEVSDVEILFVPKVTEERAPGELFGDRKVQVDHADALLNQLLGDGVLVKRPKEDGTTTWGATIKYAFIRLDGLPEIPIDFFSTTEAAWFNALVCRTGPAELNRRIAQLANKRGYSWRVGSDGFYPVDGRGITDPSREPVIVRSERDVFDFVGLPYAEPKDRR
jgi:DNA polymerase/3'-5' exonuclease PolX